MPFRSEQQRRFMWARHPEIACKWTSEHGSKIVPHKKKGKSKTDSLSDAAYRRAKNSKKKKTSKKKVTSGGY